MEQHNVPVIQPHNIAVVQQHDTVQPIIAKRSRLIKAFTSDRKAIQVAPKASYRKKL